MPLCILARRNCSKVLSIASWNSSHAFCIAARRQESMMPVSKHLYPKCQRKVPKCRNMRRHLIRESGITLLTLFVHWQLIRKWTFLKPITLTCHWWICFVCFVFNLCSIWVQFEWCSSWKKILPTICHLLCNGQKLVFWGWGWPFITL